MATRGVKYTAEAVAATFVDALIIVAAYTHWLHAPQNTLLGRILLCISSAHPQIPVFRVIDDTAPVDMPIIY